MQKPVHAVLIDEHLGVNCGVDLADTAERQNDLLVAQVPVAAAQRTAAAGFGPVHPCRDGRSLYFNRSENSNHDSTSVKSFVI